MAESGNKCRWAGDGVTPEGSRGGAGDSGEVAAVPEVEVSEGEPGGVRRKLGCSAGDTPRSGWGLQVAAGTAWPELGEMGQGRSEA